MSFLDTLDHAVVGTGVLAANSFGFVKDLAQWASGDDETSFGDVRSAAGDVVKSGYGNIIDAANFGINKVDYGLSTVAQAGFISRRRAFQQTGHIDGAREFGMLMNGDIWEEATKRAQTSSAGQSILDAFHVSSFNPTHDAYLRWTPEQFAAERKTPEYNIESGAIDAAKTWFLDPIVVGGKALSFARARYIKAPVGIGRDVYREMTTPTKGLQKYNPRNLYNRTETLIKRSKGWDAEQFAQGVDGLSDSTNGMAVASALAKASNSDPASRVENMRLVLRVAYSDMSAVDELALRRADLMDQLAQSRKTTMNSIMAAKMNTPGFNYMQQPQVVANIQRQLQNLQDLTTLTGQRVRDIERVDANVWGASEHRTLRITKSSADKALATRETPFQQAIIQHSAWSVPVRIWHSATTTRPRGFIYYDDPQSVNELRAMFDRVPKLDPAIRNRYLSSYIEASGAAPRTRIVQAAKQAVFKQIAAEHGYKEKLAQTVFADYMTSEHGVAWWRNARDAGMTRYSAVIDPKTGMPADVTAGPDGVVNIAPQLQGQLANADPMLNVDAVRHALRRNKNIYTATADWLDTADRLSIRHNGAQGVRMVGNGLYNLAEAGVDLGNWLRKWWIGGTLFRLGYPLRVVADEQMRLAAMLGTGSLQLQTEAAWAGARVFGNKISFRDRRYAKARYAQDQVLRKNLIDNIQDLSKLQKRLPRTEAHLKRMRRLAQEIQDPNIVAKYNKRITRMSKNAADIISGNAKTANDALIQQLNNDLATLNLHTPVPLASKMQMPLYRRDVPGAQMLGSQKPHGVYYSHEYPGFQSPHTHVGSVDYRATGYNPTEAEVLNIPVVKRIIPANLRPGGFHNTPLELDSGTAALHHLLPKNEVNRLWSLSKGQIQAELSKLYPSVDWHKYYDGYEMLSAYGGILARDAGYKAMWLKSGKANVPDPFDEYVALTDDAALQTADIQAADAKVMGAHQAKVDTTNKRLARATKRQANIADPAYLKELQKRIKEHSDNLRVLQLPNAKRKISARVRFHRMKADDMRQQLKAYPFLVSLLKDTEARLATPSRDLMKVYGPNTARFGTEDLQVNGGVLPGPFGDENAELYKALVANKSLDNIYNEGEKSTYARMARHGAGYVIVEPGTKGHVAAWLDAQNGQIRQDPMARQFLAGRDENYVLRTWFKTREGQAHLNNVGIIHKSDKVRWVHNVKAMVDQYVADPAWRQILLQRPLYRTELEAYIKSGKSVPAVHGANLAENLGTGAWSRMANGALNGAMRVLGQLPSDVLSRHPLYAALYRQRAKDLANRIMTDPSRVDTGRALDTLDQDELDRIYKVAHAYALKFTKQTLYDVAANSNLAHTLRFISPFMGAWGETLTRWWQLTKDRPQVLGYANNLWQMPNKLGIIVDKNGNPVPESSALNGDENLIIALPAWMGKGEGPSKTGPQFKVGSFVPYIHKNTFLLQLNGDPWWLPGFSPLVQIPVGWFADAVPKSSEVLNFIGATPMGADRGTELTQPATLKRLSSLFSSYLGDAYTRGDFQKDTITMYKQMRVQWMLDGKPNAWDENAMLDEAKQRTRKLYWLKAATSFTSPVTASFRSKYQMYIDSYNLLKKRAQAEGRTMDWVDTKFVKEYGNAYFEFVQPVSKVNAQVAPTAEGVSAFKKYRKDIAKYPDLAGSIIGPEGEGQYNENAYSYETHTAYQPGNPQTIRDYKSPRDAVEAAEAAPYWRKYIKLTQALDAIAVSRGETSHREDRQLMAYKAAYKDRWFKESPVFARDFAQKDQEWFDRNYEGVRAFSQEKRVADRADIPTLKKYVALRDTVTKILAARKAAGGSDNPTAKSNYMLMATYTAYVNRMAESNTQFDQHWMIPILERDPMLVDLSNPPAEVTAGVQ